MLKEEINHIIENVFEDNIKNEAIEVVELAFRINKYENNFKFIKNCNDKKSFEEISCRIDFVKSLLIKDGLIQNRSEDYFGKIEIDDSEPMEL
jgi:hypothetical protein